MAFDLSGAGGNVTLSSRLKKISDRLDAATPGPWIACLGSGNNECTAVMSEFTGTVIADLLTDYMLKENPEKVIHADLKLIAHAPTDLRKLIECVKVLSAALEYVDDKRKADCLEKNCMCLHDTAHYALAQAEKILEQK